MFIRGLRSKTAMLAVPVTCQRNACEAIVAEEEFLQVQERKAARTFEHRHPRTSASPYPLSSLLACEIHDANLNMEGAKDRKGGKYTCSAIRQEQRKDCTTPRLPSEDIHARVVQCLTDRILTDDAITAMAAEIKRDQGSGDKEQRLELKSTRARIASAKQRKDNLLKKVANRQMRDSDITEQMDGMRSNLELLERREEELKAELANQNAFLTDLERIKAYARDLKTYLREGNEDTLKQIFHLVIEKIIVRPGSATIRYTIPMPPDGAGDWMMSEELDLDGPVLRIRPPAHAGIDLRPICACPACLRFPRTRGASPFPVSIPNVLLRDSPARQPRHKTPTVGPTAPDGLHRTALCRPHTDTGRESINSVTVSSPQTDSPRNLPHKRWSAHTLLPARPYPADSTTSSSETAPPRDDPSPPAPLRPPRQ